MWVQPEDGTTDKDVEVESLNFILTPKHIEMILREW
jgi:hypothetical protein